MLGAVIIFFRKQDVPNSLGNTVSGVGMERMGITSFCNIVSEEERIVKFSQGFFIKQLREAFFWAILLKKCGRAENGKSIQCKVDPAGEGV